MLERSGRLRAMKTPKRPRDPNQLAKMIVDLTTQSEPADDSLASSPSPVKNAAAVELGRLGGLKGGRARADSLTAEERSDIAKKAAAKRWEKAD